jgi:hypothetical protein
MIDLSNVRKTTVLDNRVERSRLEAVVHLIKGTDFLIGRNAASGAALVPALVKDGVTVTGVYTDYVLKETDGSTLVTEGGASDTYSIALAAQPVANVTVTATPDAQVTVSPVSLTFTPSNWATPQTITVSPVNDTLREGTPHGGAIVHTSASADAGYHAIRFPTVVVQITDNDNSGSYTTWANSFLPGNNVSNPAGDNDNDGLVNQQEFAFGLSPISGSSVNPITAQLNKITGQFSYQRRAGSGLTYKILTSTTLATGSWTQDLTASQVAGVTDGNGNQTVVVTLTGAPLAASKLFVAVEAN